jgi:hypothetical protein
MGFGDPVTCAGTPVETCDSFSPKEAIISDYLKTSEGRTKLADSMASPTRYSSSRGEVGVGAGAEIRQSFDKSKKSVGDWEKKPAGVIRLYFVFQEQFEKYAEAGFNNLKGNEMGYLAELPVGGK